MRTTGIRVAPQPTPRSAPANPVPLPRTKFAIDASPVIKRKEDDPSPTLKILTQTILPPHSDPCNIKSGHNEVMSENSPTTTISSFDSLSPPVCPTPTPPVSKSSHTSSFPPTVSPSTPPSSPDPKSPPPKPPRTYRHNRGPGNQQAGMVRESREARIPRDPSGSQHSPATTPRPGLIMSVLSPAMSRHRPVAGSQLQEDPQERQTRTNDPQYPQPSPQHTKSKPQSSQSAADSTYQPPKPYSQSSQSGDPTNHPTSLSTNPQTMQPHLNPRAPPSVPPQWAKPKPSNQPTSLPLVLPYRPTSSELNSFWGRQRGGGQDGQDSGTQNSGEQRTDGQARRQNGQRSNRQNYNEQRKQNGSEQRSDEQNRRHNDSGQRNDKQNRREQRSEGQNRGEQRQNRSRNNKEQRNEGQNRNQNIGESRRQKDNSGQGHIRPPTTTLLPTRPAPPPIPKKPPPSHLRGPEPACTAEEFETSCQEVFKHRRSATKHAAAGRYVQAARHYQTALTAMDRVLGTHVLAITPSEPTRQHLFSLQEEVFTLRKEVLHGFMDAQTAAQTPSRHAISTTPTPGAPPSYDDVLKEDQRRHQEEIPPLPPRQPSMRGRASQYTRPRQSHSARHARTNSASEQTDLSHVGSEGESRRPREGSIRPRPPTLRTRPSSVTGVDSRVETLVDVAESHAPSTPATAPPTFPTQPLCPTQVPIRPKSYHSGHSSILTPLTPTPVVPSQPFSSTSQAPTVVSQSSSKTTTSSCSSSNTLDSTPSLPPPLSASTTSFSSLPSTSFTFAQSFSAPARGLGAKPKSSSSDQSSPVSPDMLDEVMESQMAALELCQTKRGVREMPKSPPLQHQPTVSPPITPETPLSLPKSPPSKIKDSDATDRLFSDLQSFGSAFSSSHTSLNIAKPQSAGGNTKTTPSSATVTSKPSTAMAKIEDPFKTVDPFPPVNPEDVKMSETPFPDNSPLPSMLSRRREGAQATENFASEQLGNKHSATAVKMDNNGKVSSTKDENNQNKFAPFDFSSSNDHEDSILEALDPAIINPHQKVTPRRSNGSTVPRCHSEETLLDHSYGTLNAVLKQSRARSASRSSIIEEFDPLVTAFMDTERHTAGSTEVDGSQDCTTQATGSYDYPKPNHPKAMQDTKGLAKECNNYPEAVVHDRVTADLYDTAAKEGEEASAQPAVKLRRGGAHPRVPMRYAGIVRVPEEEQDEEEDRPVVYQEEGAMAEEGEAWGEEGRAVRGTYDDLYYDSDEIPSGKGLGNMDMRSSFSSSNSQRSWPQDPPPSQLYPTIEKYDLKEEEESSVGIGRSAFYRANRSQPEQSPGSSTHRHLLRIREGVKIFFLHSDGIITSPYNKPVLSVTKDLTRNFLVGEGVTVSVGGGGGGGGGEQWRCELHCKQTLVLRTLNGVYIFKDTGGKMDCGAVGIRVPNNVRKAQQDLLHHILQENTLLEEERPRGITKAISKGASTAATRVNTIVGTQMYDMSQAFIRRNSIRALKGVSKHLNTLAEKTGSNMKELPEEYKELQEMADQLRIARSAKMVQYI